MSDTSTLSAAELAAITQHNVDAWNRCAPTYAEGFEALTGGAIPTILDLVGAGRDVDLLDVGTGPGSLIGLATDRGARVRALDLAPEMVEVARRRHPDIQIDVADGSSLPHRDASFDAVTLGFCLHHAADPRAVLDEAHRVLRPGGRIAYAVWGEEAGLEAFGIAFNAFAEVVAVDEVLAPQPPSIGSTPGDHERLLSRAGFEHTIARKLHLAWSVTGAAPILDGFTRFLGLEDLSESQRQDITQRLDDAIRRRAGSDGVATLANPAIVAAGRKPLTAR